MSVGKVVDIVLQAGWQTIPIGLANAGRIEEVYITSTAGVTLDRFAVGSLEVYSDTTLPQNTGYYASDVVVGAGAVGPGYSDVPGVGGLYTGPARTATLGIKSPGAATVTVTVKGVSNQGQGWV